MKRLTLMISLVALLPAAARADITLSLGHGKLHLPVPEGYCAVDTDRARDSALFDYEAKSLQGRGSLLAVTADCAELEAYRAHNRPIKRLVTFTAASKDGQLVRRPEAERATFIDEVAQDAGKIDPKDMAAFETRWWNSFNANANAEVRQFNVAERDENAAYLRMVRLAGRSSERVSVASVWAVTAVGGYEISVNVYEPGDEGTLPGLIAAAKREAAQLVAANPPAPSLPPPPAVADQPADAAGQDLPPLSAILAKSGSTIVIVAGGVLLVSFLLLLIVRRAAQR